ncbi:hypothetical protein KEA45_05325, partial [Treponema pallidum]
MILLESLITPRYMFLYYSLGHNPREMREIRGGGTPHGIGKDKRHAAHAQRPYEHITHDIRPEPW